MVFIEDALLNREDKVITIATQNPVFCFENEKLDKVCEKLINGFRRMAVVNGSKEVIGIITITDFLKSLFVDFDLKKSVKEIMNREPLVLEESDNIDFLLKMFKFSKRGGFPIVDKNSKLVAMVSERDFLKNFKDVFFNVKVRDAMTKKPLIVKPSFTIRDVIKSFILTGYRRFLVLDNSNNLIGIVTSIDALKFLYSNNFSDEAFNYDITKIMVKDILSINFNEDLSEFIKITYNKFVGGLPVLDDDNKLVGLITERDIINFIE